MTRLIIPHLSANVTDATLTQWLKEPDDEVRKGDAVAEITTEKAVFELESTADGTLIERLAPAGSMLPVGFIVALIGKPGETDPEARTSNRACIEAARRERETTFQSASMPAESHPTDGKARIRATPKARRIAREKGLDLETVQKATGAEIVTESLLKDYLDGLETCPPRGSAR